MKVVVCKTAIQEAELLSRLSYDCLFHDQNPILLWNQILRFTNEEGKARRKELRKEGFITKCNVETTLGTKILFLVVKAQNANEGVGQHHILPVPRKVQPLAQTTPYLAEYTQRTWNTLAKKVGLPTVTTVGEARLKKVCARLKECFGKPESIWAEVLDGIEISVRKYPALVKSSWLDYDHVVASQKNFDKARQGRIAMYSDRGKTEAEEHMPSYLGGRR